MPYLRLLSKDSGADKVFLPPGQPFTIGRGAASSYRIRDLKMSRVHCELAISAGVTTLTDLGSMNGTHVNGDRISSIALKDGDIIQAGYTHLQYIEGEVGEPTLPESAPSAAEGAAGVALHEPSEALPAEEEKAEAPQEPPESNPAEAPAAEQEEVKAEAIEALLVEFVESETPTPAPAEPESAGEAEPAVILESAAEESEVVMLEPAEGDPAETPPEPGGGQGVVLLETFTPEPPAAPPESKHDSEVVMLGAATPEPAVIPPPRQEASGVVLLDTSAEATPSAAPPLEKLEEVEGPDDNAIVTALRLDREPPTRRPRRGEVICSSCHQPVAAKEVKAGVATDIHGQVCCPRCIEADPLVGKTVVGYHIEAKLGSGAWSTTYKAQQLSMARPVVLRVLKREMAGDSELITQFLATVKRGGQISHPNLARIYDIGRTAGLCYVCVEYIDGESLARLLPRKARFSAEDAADTILQVAGAVDIAHRRDVFHRDIRPSNIILNDEKIPKLVGLGFAKSIMDAAAAGAITIGYSADLVQYWAPECLADPTHASQEADVYSIGAVLYAMLAGHAPFEADDPTRLVQIIRRLRPKPLDALRNDVPHRLSAVVAKAMAKRPADRYPGCQQFIQDLGSALI